MTNKNKPVEVRKLKVFKALSFLVPVLLLILLEATLRLFGYGHNTDLFIKYEKDDRFLQVNPRAADKFFTDTANTTSGGVEMFTINKSPDTFRIFVLGESTTIGYPYFHNAAFHRWLQFRLMQMYPNKNFEVINLSMTALNSYTVLDFGKQLSTYQPDAVMIYVGHNEYYGAMGVGSTSYLGSNHFIVETLIKLRETRVGQLLSNFMAKIKSLSAKKIDTRDNLMKRMARTQEIPYGSKEYLAGINQFNYNMNELCHRFNDEHIPVFLSTVVSNEKDLPPFISKGNGPASAAYNYHAGLQNYEKGEYALAKAYFDKAKDLDELRFRAPEAINTIIQNLAAKYPVVHLVDVKKLFEQYSPHGIIGKETILEHVHPNLYGYAIMSDAFFRAFQQQHLITDAPQKTLSFDELRKEMPITQMDSLTGLYQIMFLKRGWPFNQPLPAVVMLKHNLDDTLAVELALGRIKWKDALGAMFDRAEQTGNKAKQRTVAEAMALEYPQNGQFCNMAASLNTDLGDYDMAALYYKKLNSISPNDRLIARVIKLYLRAGELNNAMSTVKDLPSAQQEQVKSILTRISIAKQLLDTNKEGKQAFDTLAANYKKLGIPDSLITAIMK
jgi:tetratricopeptide (TPR) repeat protein